MKQFDYDDCKRFADKIRFREFTSGPWWPHLARFVPMFDEISRLRSSTENKLLDSLGSMAFTSQNLKRMANNDPDLVHSGRVIARLAKLVLCGIHVESGLTERIKTLESELENAYRVIADDEALLFEYTNGSKKVTDHEKMDS